MSVHAVYSLSKLCAFFDILIKNTLLPATVFAPPGGSVKKSYTQQRHAGAVA
jgi:hypothetical protein